MQDLLRQEFHRAVLHDCLVSASDLHACHQDLGRHQCGVCDYHALIYKLFLVLVRGNHRHYIGTDLNPDSVHACMQLLKNVVHRLTPLLI